MGVSTPPTQSHLLVHNRHNSCADSHPNGHTKDEELVHTQRLYHCNQKEDRSIQVALPLVFWCVRSDKVNDESVMKERENTSFKLNSSFYISSHLIPALLSTNLSGAHFKTCGLTKVKRSLISLKTPPRKKAPPNDLVRAHTRDGEPFFS